MKSGIVQLCLRFTETKSSDVFFKVFDSVRQTLETRAALPQEFLILKNRNSPYEQAHQTVCLP